ncbi:non-specific lipid transfer protein GPI-anchored 25 [Malania oleifera]|uniref:non-specific lipid transfer protein GPI-anchored 25 n=1 Tax=Malania oleifera TaxID=397392 RepID=UPI0025AE9E19|nr:non-specific lipid transfer protein GPI-anchored 25 [Malania oleifera]
MKLTDSILFPATVALILMSMVAEPSTAAEAPPPPGGCTDELVSFSPCLPYVSSPPNNATSSAPSQCCDAFASAFDGDGVHCLCYLLRQPLLLGFPLNTTRLLSLPPLCLPVNASSSAANGSLESLCSGSPALPPLQGTAADSWIPEPPEAGISQPLNSDSGLSNPPASGASQPQNSETATSASPLTSSTPEPTRLPRLPRSSAKPAIASFATKRVNDSGIMILLRVMISLATHLFVFLVQYLPTRLSSK